MLESYNTVSITQSVLRGDYLGGFSCLLCLKKDWRIMQPIAKLIILPMKARSDDDIAKARGR